MSGVPSKVGPGPSRITSPPSACGLAGLELRRAPGHPPLHRFANVRVQRVVGRPIGAALAVEPNQAPRERFRRIRRPAAPAVSRDRRIAAPARENSPGERAPAAPFRVGRGRSNLRPLARRGSGAAFAVRQVFRQHDRRGTAITQVLDQVLSGSQRVARARSDCRIDPANRSRSDTIPARAAAGCGPGGR